MIDLPDQSGVAKNAEVMGQRCLANGQFERRTGAFGIRRKMSEGRYNMTPLRISKRR